MKSTLRELFTAGRSGKGAAYILPRRPSLMTEISERNEVKMKRILVTLPVTEEQKQQYADRAPEAEFVFCRKEDVTKEMVSGVTAVIGNIAPSMLAGNQKIEWVQLNSAGTDGYLADGVIAGTAVLTNATGAYGVAIAEHMTGQLLMLLKRFPSYLEQQKAHIWKDSGKVRPIIGSRVLIVGLGDIGMEFASRMKAFGAHVTGIRRTLREKPDCVDETDTAEHLEKHLAQADVVAVCLPGTRDTFHMFSERQFAAMKEGAVFINVGRGNIVDTEALVKALKEGKLWGASLDVFEQEPLPGDSELWSCPNLLITPHVSGGFHLQYTVDRIVEISLKNLDAYMHGRDYVSVVDRTTGYKVSGSV